MTEGAPLSASAAERAGRKQPLSWLFLLRERDLALSTMVVLATTPCLDYGTQSLQVEPLIGSMFD